MPNPHHNPSKGEREWGLSVLQTDVFTGESHYHWLDTAPSVTQYGSSNIWVCVKMFTSMCIVWTSKADCLCPFVPCLTSRTSPGGLFSHRPKQWLPLAQRMVVFSGETRPSPPATRSTSHCCCWSVKAHSLSSPWAAVERGWSWVKSFFFVVLQ